MQFQNRFITNLTLGLCMSAIGPFSYNALAGQNQPNNVLLNKQLYEELVKSKHDLNQGNIQDAKESFAKMKNLTNGAPEYQVVINKLQTEIDKKQGIVGNTRMPQGAKPAQQASSTLVSDIDQKDIDAFDNAYDAFDKNKNTDDKNKIIEMDNIIKRIESTPGNSPKKENFLIEAKEKLDHLMQEQSPTQKRVTSRPKTRTPKGFSDALDGFNLESKKGLSNANIASAKDSLAKMKQYATGSETDQSYIKQVEEKIKEYEKSVMGTKTRTPMGNMQNHRTQSPPQPPQNGQEHQAKTDISDEDIAAFKSAYETDNVKKAEEIYKRYPRTAQDSKKKIETLDLWDMQLQTMG